MAGFVIERIRKVPEKNRMYIELEELVPRDELIANLFHIKHYEWKCWTGFFDMDHHREFSVQRSSEWFEIQVMDQQRDMEFEVRVGIVRKSGKEVVVSNVEVISPEKSVAVIRLIRRSELDKVMQSYKELKFFMATDEKEEEKAKFYRQMFQRDFKELLLSGTNSDFTIHVKDRKFEVHKSFLGARSPVFSAMMEHEMREKRNGEVTIIDTDPAVFQEFLLYLYTGNGEHLDWKNVADLYTLGDKYCVEDLKHLCVKRMKTHISIDNFFQVFYLSLQLYNSELSENVFQFFSEDANEIIASEKHTEFMKEHPAESIVLMYALEDNIEPQ